MKTPQVAASGRVQQFLSSGWFLAAVLVVAASLRLAHVLALRPLPLFQGLIVDSWLYDAWAQEISAGDWLGGGRAFYMDPLYPYLLAILYKSFGHDLLLVRLVQIGMGVATCGLVAVIGRRASGALVGNLGAGLLAVYKPAIFHEGEIEKTALGVLLVTATLALLLGRSRLASLSAGAMLGLATLTRGNVLLLLPLGAVFLLFWPRGSEPPQAEAAGGERPRGEGAARAVAFLLGCLVVLAPVAARNHYVSGEWILTTSQAGANFYTGNNPTNLTGGYQPVPFVRPHPRFEEEDFRAEAERRVGRPLGPGGVSSFWFSEGRQYIYANPRNAAMVWLRKLGLAFGSVETPDGWDPAFLARFSPVLAAPLLGMGCLLPLAGLGVLGFRRRREVWLLSAFLAVYALSLSAFFVFSRYRLHMVPALTVLAAMGLVWLVEVIRARDAQRSAAAILVAAALAAVSVIGTWQYRREFFQSHVDLAELYVARGEMGPAESLLAEAVSEGPAQPSALCGMGWLKLQMGQPEMASAVLEQCVHADPAFPNAWYLLGRSYARLQRPIDAAQAFHRQIGLVPGHEEAAWHLAELDLRQGLFEDAAALLGRMWQKGSREPLLVTRLAVALYAGGHEADAARVLRESGLSDSALDLEYARLLGRARR